MARIGHKKSRTGCSRCKQRKVKCDERRPCSACVKYNICCSLTSSLGPGSAPGQVNLNPSLACHANPIAAAASPKHPITIPSSVLADADSHFSPFSLLSNPTASLPPDWTVDLSLMNHYTALTASTLPGANHHTWQSEIPREAVAYPFLMHQILAISAFHLASLDSSQRQTHLSQAFQHQHHAIRRIKQEISDITPRNRQALFVASSLLFMGAFASTSQATARPCQREVDSLLGIFTLVRGVSGILSSSKESNRHGILGQFMQCDSPPKRTRLLGLLLEELPRIRERFARDRHMSHEAKALADEAIDGLRESAGRAAAAATELTVAIVWPMTLSDGFLTLLRMHHPVALVVVAHYCTVLCAAGSEFWFMRGWGRRIVDAVAESLMPSWHEAIRWPLAFIKSSETSRSQGQGTLRLEPSDPRRGQELEATM